MFSSICGRFYYCSRRWSYSNSYGTYFIDLPVLTVIGTLKFQLLAEHLCGYQYLKKSNIKLEVTGHNDALAFPSALGLPCSHVCNDFMKPVLVVLSLLVVYTFAKTLGNT
jgi:hypothetical protein